MTSDERKLWLLDETTGEAEIIEAVDTLRSQPRLALDLEADSFHRYTERVCLLQVGTSDLDLVYDPITHGLHPSMRALMTDPARTWVLHGGDYDVLSLKRDFELELGRLFDTHVAARFLGYEGLGLQSLLDRELGIRISKGEQRSDWRRRPLTDEQLRYARQDVAHLLPLAERMIEHLVEKGRMSWVEEECELLRQRVPVTKPVDPDAWAKLKGARDLPDPGPQVVRALFWWRDRLARRLDRAPFRVLPNETIVDLARQTVAKGPPAPQDLRHARGVARNIDADDLAREIRAATTAPRPPRARARGPHGTPVPPGTRAKIEALKKARHDWGAELELDPALVLPPALIDAIAPRELTTIDALGDVPGMTRWRREAIGPALLRVLGSG